jgi:hypothetical protein
MAVPKVAPGGVELNTELLLAETRYAPVLYP